MAQTLTRFILILFIITIFASSATLDANNHSPRKALEPLDDASLMNRLGRKLGYFGNGVDCFLCTMFVTVVQQYTQLHSIHFDEFFMKKLCRLFPIGVRSPCKGMVKQYGAQIVESLRKSPSPDQACRAIKVCSNPQCNLIPADKFPSITMSPNWEKNIQEPVEEQSLNPVKWFKDILERISDHQPALDLDEDGHSSVGAQLRGYNWRGRDCNDLDPNIHPGRKTDPYPESSIDYNCNGIKGKNRKTGKKYKEELCGNTQNLGVAVIGDSAGAFASIPENWINASQWDAKTFISLLPILLNEVDFPHYSAYTGYLNDSPRGPSRSIYQKLYERNKCNFRDYQNLAVNGADSFDTQDFVMALARDKERDSPILGFLELLGNDLCWYNQTFDVMTKPEEFRQNINRILHQIDNRFPPGSHLVIIGLVNGSMIYDGVKEKTHPIGVTYPHFYDYQNCIGASFCWGWLNSNQTIREITTQKAMELNAVYKEVLANFKPKNFDFVFYEAPSSEIVNEWVKTGHDAFELIERVDGFHPNQLFNSLLADKLWSNLERDHPEWLGQVNPNNDRITQLFGNQGGY